MFDEIKIKEIERSVEAMQSLEESWENINRLIQSRAVEASELFGKADRMVGSVLPYDMYELWVKRIEILSGSNREVNNCERVDAAVEALMFLRMCFIKMDDDKDK